MEKYDRLIKRQHAILRLLKHLSEVDSIKVADFAAWYAVFQNMLGRVSTLTETANDDELVVAAIKIYCQESCIKSLGK